MTSSPAEEPHIVTSFDGTAIAGRFTGDPAAPALLLVNAIGANLASWRGTLRELVPDFSVVTWDLRGLHSSDPPATDGLEPPGMRSRCWITSPSSPSACSPGATGFGSRWRSRIDTRSA